ncbi:MAG: phosphoglycerate kinase, partial [Methanomassiliicoccaceae archaeon]|nr:phosphoglycerate kinase [Methanomassiliicoccaceae archaeon]
MPPYRSQRRTEPWGYAGKGESTKDFNTLGDFNFKDKTVLLRVDINCPLNKKDLRVLNDSRIRSIVPTVRELMGK